MKKYIHSYHTLNKPMYKRRLKAQPSHIFSQDLKKSGFMPS